MGIQSKLLYHRCAFKLCTIASTVAMKCNFELLLAYSDKRTLEAINNVNSYIQLTPSELEYGSINLFHSMSPELSSCRILKLINGDQSKKQPNRQTTL